MKKSQLYTLSGALLASTALAGVANAGTVGRVDAQISTNGGNMITATASIANTLFSTTAATANAVQFGAGTGANSNPLAASFTNTLPVSTSFNATINATGATMNNPNVGVAVLARAASGTGTFIGTIQGACNSITPLVDKILVTACQISSFATAGVGGAAAVSALAGGLQFSGVIFTNASGLATAGGTIALSGTVNDNGNPAIVIENITSGNVVTSAAPLKVSSAAGATVVTNATTTPTAFTSFSTSALGSLSMTLATVTISNVGTLGTDLNTIVTSDGNTGQAAAGTVAITVTSAVLADDATVALRLNNATTNQASVITPAGLTTGAATFNVTGTNFRNATILQANFNGTSAINAAGAGTVDVAFGNGAPNGHAQTPAGLTGGATASVVAGGFSAEFNTALASGGDFQSFLRIHNNGNSAGTVTITVLNEADGTTLGTHTTGSLAVGQTMQVDMPTIEAGAGITTPSGTYTLQLAGPIIGYAQHVLFNASTGQFSDLSSFRNGGSSSNVP